MKAVVVEGLDRMVSVLFMAAGAVILGICALLDRPEKQEEAEWTFRR